MIVHISWSRNLWAKMYLMEIENALIYIYKLGYFVNLKWLYM